MKPWPKIALMAAATSLAVYLSITITLAQVDPHRVFLPFLSNPPGTDNPSPTATTESTGVPTPTSTPTSTATPTSTSTPTPTATPTITPTPTLPDPTFDDCQEDPIPESAANYPVRIVNVVKDADPEIVQLRNESGETVDLTGWRMCSITGNQEHLGISGSLTPGQTRDFPHTGPGSIWNNTERDDGAHYNAAGQLVSYWIDP